MTVPQVLRKLDALRRQQLRARGERPGAGRRRHGAAVTRAVARLPLVELRKIARRIGHRHGTALALWNTGCRDARVLATLVEQPHLVEDTQLDRWIQTAGDRSVADRVCLEVVVQTPWARSKVGDWAHHPQPLVRRAAYVVLRALARRDREMTDADFIPWVDAVPSAVAREDEAVRTAMLGALSAVAARNEILRGRVLGATSRLRREPREGAAGGPAVPAGRPSLVWRRAG
jgi:3-methyladenine DNA glycosylase AlkD